MALTIDSKISGDLVAVGGSPQSDAQTAATINKLILFDETSFLQQQRNAESNAAEKTGENEATEINILSLDGVAELNQPKATPDALAWAMRMIMGAPTTAALGTGYSHLFKLDSYPDNPDYFTAAHRKGGSGATAPAGYQRYVGNAIGSLELAAAKDQFFKLGLGCVGLGLVDDALYTEVVTGVSFDSGFTFVITYDPEGATDGERATKLFVMADLDDDGIYETELTVTAYVSSTNTVTFSDPSSSGSHSVKATYHVDDAESGFTWQTELSGLSVPTEFILKAANMRLWLGRAIDASGSGEPTSTDGQYAQCELDDFTYTFDRSAEPGRCWRVLAGSSDDYAQSVELGDVVQTLSLNRKVRDWLMKQAFDDNAAFGIEIDAIGPEFAAAEGNYYRFNMYFPYCKILNREDDTADGKHRDALEVLVLKTSGQPTAAAWIQNKQSSYA
jgi:hypothetical protein